MNQFKNFNIQVESKGMIGDKIKIDRILNREIIVHDYNVVNSKFSDKGNGKCLHLQIAIGEAKHVVFTGSGVLIETILKVPKKDLPFSTKIIKENDRFQFT